MMLVFIANLTVPSWVAGDTLSIVAEWQNSADAEGESEGKKGESEKDDKVQPTNDFQIFASNTLHSGQSQYLPEDYNHYPEMVSPPPQYFT